MRSRTFREGSVGLLLLLGIGAFVGILLWLTRFTTARNSYRAIIEFADAGGLQRGTVVRYRGVRIGTITALQPGPNVVEAIVEIARPNLLIPSDVQVQSNQSGLIGESIIDITPRTTLPLGTVTAKPLDKDCNPKIIVCNNSRLKGEVGISIDQLIRSTTELANAYTDPQFYRRINRAVDNASVAAINLAELSRNFILVSKSVQQQVDKFSATNDSILQATNDISTSTTRALGQIGNTADEISNTANQFGATAREISSTTTQVSNLVKDIDSLVTDNRSGLVATLNNITETSNQLRTAVSNLSPAVDRLAKGELLNNLETLSANAAQASANLRQLTTALSDPNNVLVLQQTLDSARVTFENAQKITSDLDDLTGDPTFRQNLRQLVNGLGDLVSSTQQMQQQVQIATTLDTLKAAINNSKVAVVPSNASQLQITPSSIPTTQISGPGSGISSQQPFSLSTPSSSQDNLFQRLQDYQDFLEQTQPTEAEKK